MLGEHLKNQFNLFLKVLVKYEELSGKTNFLHYEIAKQESFDFYKIYLNVLRLM